MPDYGFWITGSPVNGKRRLVDIAAAYAAYAACDENCKLNNESYLSAFWYGKDFQAYLDKYATVKNYIGACYSPWLWFDIDRENNLEAAKADTAKLAAYLVSRYAVQPASLLIFFSGAKGFHIGLPLTWQPTASDTFHTRSRIVAERLGAEAGISIDTAIYTKTQPFRSPNSRHAKTGLYKRLITFEQLSGWTMGQIVATAASPQPFNLVYPIPKADSLLRGGWDNALTENKSQPIRQRSEAAKQAGRLNSLTIDFIRHGAANGNRAMVLFSAAANLAEFGCSQELAYGLLLEAALDCGLPPSEAKRQIDCGLAKGGSNG